MAFIKLSIYILAFVLLSNLPYIGYFPYQEIDECLPPPNINMINCGGEIKGAYLNPVFWSPFILLDAVFLDKNITLKTFLSSTHGYPQHRTVFNLYYYNLGVIYFIIHIIYAVMTAFLLLRLYKKFTVKKL